MQDKKSLPVISRQYGFTLVEMLMVIAIIAVLATIGFKAFTENRIKTCDTQVLSVMRSLLTAAETRLPTNAEIVNGATSPGQYPEITLNQGMILTIANVALPANDMYQFYMAHERGRLGFYFWIGGETCNVVVDKTDPSVGGPIPSDTIVPTFATVGTYDWPKYRTNAGL
ncbi:MAG: type IV pilin protein [Syntrophobacteria bacterium]